MVMQKWFEDWNRSVVMGFTGTGHQDKVPVQIMSGKGESVQHVVTECEKLAQKEYKTGHKNVGKKCRKWKNESVVGYQCSVWQRDRGKKARHNCNWKEKTKGIIINIAVPADVRVGKKKGKKWKECL